MIINGNQEEWENHWSKREQKLKLRLDQVCRLGQITCYAPHGDRYALVKLPHPFPTPLGLGISWLIWETACETSLCTTIKTEAKVISVYLLQSRKASSPSLHSISFDQLHGFFKRFRCH